MILIISSVFPPEPVVSATLSHDLAVALSEKVKVKVVTPKPSRPFGFSFKENKIETNKFEQIVLNSFTCPESKLLGRMRESFSFGKHVARYIKRNQADIQCVYINAWPLLAQYFIVKVSRICSIPAILHVHDIYPESLFGKLPFLRKLLVRFLLPLDKYNLKYSERIITISPQMKEFLIRTRKIDVQKVDVIYNWQVEEGFLELSKTKKKKEKNLFFTFMFLGSLSKTSSLEILIKAYELCNLKNSRLIFAGDGAQKNYLISMAKSCTLGNIEFWEAPISKVPYIQEKADVLILPLKKGASMFALPSKLSSYMLSGKFIIACVEEESDTAKTIKQANCGWIVPSENTEALVKAMRTAVKMPEKDLKFHGENGFNYALKYFSKQNNLGKLATIILEKKAF